MFMQMKKVYILFLFFCTQQAWSQNYSVKTQSKIDSLGNFILSESKYAAIDTALPLAYINLAELLYVSYPDTLSILCEKAKQLGEKGLENKKLGKKEKLSFQYTIASALNDLGYDFRYKGNFGKALDYYFQALKISEVIDNKNSQAVQLNNIGALYESQGDYAKALEYNNKSLKIEEIVGDQSIIAFSYNNIAGIYATLGDTTNAIRCHNISLHIKEKLGDKRGMANSLSNLSDLYFDKNQLPIALDYALKSLKFATEANDQKETAYALNVIGGIYKKRGDLVKSEEYYQKSLDIFLRIKDKTGTAMNYNCMVEIYSDQNNISKAIQYGLLANKEAKEVRSIVQQSYANKLLSANYKKIGKYKEALETYTTYIELHDSIKNQNNQKAIIRQDIKSHYEKQKIRDEKEHEKQMLLANEKEQKQKMISYSVLGGLLILLFLTFFVINRLRITNKQKQIIEHQKNLLEEKQIAILDSIHYAKRIQKSLLPTEKYIERNINRLRKINNP
jgi:two-component system sensor histidine kinase/response regulator